MYEMHGVMMLKMCGCSYGVVMYCNVIMLIGIHVL